MISSQNKYSTLTTLINIGVTIALIWLLLSWVNFNKVTDLFGRISWWIVVLGFLISINGNIISALKLWTITRHWRNRFGFFRAFNVYYIGVFFNNLLPTSLGGDVPKILILSDNSISLKNAAGMVTLSRGFGFLSLFYLGVIGSLPYFGILEMMGVAWLRSYLIVLGIIGVVTIFATLYWISYLKEHAYFEQLENALAVLEDNFRAWYFLVTIILLSVVYHLNTILLYWILSYSLGQSIEVTSLLVGVPLITLFSMIPSSFGALGVREAGITTFFTAVGLTPEAALGVALLARIISYINALLGGIFYFCNQIRFWK